MATRDPLARYRAKRDFSRSAEPQERQPDGAPAGGLRPSASWCRSTTRAGCITTCAWNGRLLKSWAVTRGPSLDPADKRLAVEVEDHPLDYGSFEGVIAEGYGAGTVMVWDSGSWEPAPEIDDPAEALARGNLKFVLQRRAAARRLGPGADEAAAEGAAAAMAADQAARRRGAARRGRAAARGGDHLRPVRPHHGGDRGREGAGEEAGEGRRPARRWAGRRRRKCAEAARPAPRLAGFVPPMLCTLVDRAPEGAGWVHEVKLDGYRMQAIVAGGAARLMTRSGLDWTRRFPETGGGARPAARTRCSTANSSPRTRTASRISPR